MNYTFHQLKVFMSVVEKESVTKAAEALNMTQPAVSIQLKNLQDQFDIPLTEVIGRKLHITEFGRELYRIAENILQEVSNINYKMEIPPKQTPFHRVKLTPFFRAKVTPHFRVKLTPVLAT